MPISRYNKAFGGKKGSAQEAHDAMVKQYGQKKGESIFYALVNKRAPGLEQRRRRRRRESVKRTRRGARASAAK